MEITENILNKELTQGELITFLWGVIVGTIFLGVFVTAIIS